jgi:drug/metabolite transporter (DMT)-like permease
VFGLGVLVPLNAVFALLSAMCWGCGDFAGGLGVKAAGAGARGALKVVAFSHVVSLLLVLPLLWLRHEPLLWGAGARWALVAGLSIALSLTTFYVALSRGAMGASAAISGVLAAAVPAIVSSLREGRPTALHGFGFVLAAIAIWLIAAAPAVSAVSAVSARDRTSLWLAAAAGCGFGVYFTALGLANSAGVLWPMALSRLASLAACTLLLAGFWLVRRRNHEDAATPTNTRAVLGWGAVTGALGTGGDGLFIAATLFGRLDVAGVLASLYPAGTIALASLVLGETLSRRQWIGIAMAAVAVVAIVWPS